MVQLTPEGKRGHLDQNTVKLVTKMIQAGNSVPEIRRTLGGINGQSILSYDDVRNWSAENTQSFSVNSLDKDARNLMSHISNKSYLVAYQKALDGSESRCSLASIFFMHETALEEVRSRGEVFIMDATYKTNNLGMPLISIQSVSHVGGNSLMSTPIAYAFVANEKIETYVWFLKSFKQAIFSCSREGIDPIFVIDKCSVLMNAIDQVFPNSKTMLCTWHMNQNFNKELSHIFIKSEDKQKCIELIREMIVSYTEDEFNDACRKYKVIATNNSFLQDCSSQKAQVYLESNWLVCKDKWAGYITRMYNHFGCTTSQRVEGIHSALKSGSTSTRLDLLSSFDEVDKYVNRQIIKQKMTGIKEGCYVDGMIRNNVQLAELVGKVSARALLTIQKSMLKARMMSNDKKRACMNNTCSCSDRIIYALPCKHEIVRMGDKVLVVEDISSRWLLKNATAYNTTMATNTPVVNIPDTDDKQRIEFHQADIGNKVNKTDEFSSIWWKLNSNTVIVSQLLSQMLSVIS
ncbi:hypothetical protein INT47_005998 [Mucor saturninus]|uniref:SWIM-type domain-containing protein n=1 Tax=Mucor saturninus TaxID=64648 RepID=A0A8H7QFX6_9FUNG|nr:hypothetical protein INT47_005998 [Mucor saturninus]